MPSDNEWQTLIDFAGGDKIAGKILKASSGGDGSGNGTDTYGFAALPGGFGHSNGDFGDVGNDGNWWSSSESKDNLAYFRRMFYSESIFHSNEIVYRSSDGKTYLFSVRCLQD